MVSLLFFTQRRCSSGTFGDSLHGLLSRGSRRASGLAWCVRGLELIEGWRGDADEALAVLDRGQVAPLDQVVDELRGAAEFGGDFSDREMVSDWSWSASVE